MKVKEYLSARGVDFESINVAADAAGLAELRERGMRGVPVVAMGDNCVYAQDLEDVAALVGIEWEKAERLPPDELVARCLNLLRVALMNARLVPADRLDDRLPGRNRSYLELVNHIVEICAGFIAVTRGEAFDGRIADATPEPTMGLDELERYRDRIASDLRAWGKAESDSSKTVDTYYGRKTLHLVLERCTWHATQHTRQLLMVLGMLGIDSPAPLRDEDLAGLPLPKDVWDA